MNFIKKIVDGKVDESVHMQFQKFSKGEFRNKTIIEVKKTAKNFTIKTSAEFANEFVRIMAEKLGDKKTKVTGAIVSTSDLKEKLEYENIKRFQGVKKYLINKEMSGKEILDLLEEFPKTFFGLTFNVGEDVLKIKAKAPKSAKPGKGDEAPKADFCSLKTTDKKIVESFVFEKPDFKKAVIAHTFFVESIVVPDELKGEKDFAIVREKSLRKGKIVRRAEIDEIKSEKIIEFEA